MPTQSQQSKRINYTSLGWLETKLGWKRGEIRQVARTAGAYYKPFDVSKGYNKTGIESWRHIDNPTEPLKSLQYAIYKHILKPYAETLPYKFATGGMPNRSILDNARPHIDKETIVGLDLKNCFPSIKADQVLNVWKEKLGLHGEVASLLTMLTTFQNRLPQGSPASPVLCNLVLLNMALEIDDCAKSNDLGFSIYIDDVTLSGSATQAREAINTVIPIVSRHGMKINKRKICIVDADRPQKATGILINKRQTVQDLYVQKVKREITRLADKRFSVTKKELNSVYGRIQFVQTVDKKKGEKLEALASSKIADIVGLEGIKKQDRRRPCKNFRGKH